MQPDSPVARRGDLVAFEIEELVGRHVLGQDVLAVRFEHRREDDAVEDDIVLADEVHHLGSGVLPITLPVWRQLLRGGYIADRRVEPHVEHLALGPLDRNGDAPVQITAHGTRLQSQIEPALALPVDVGTPLLVPFENPLAQKSLVLVERQVPVLGLALDERRTGQRAVGCDQFVGRKRRSALLALVAVGLFVLAVGTGAHDVTVGQKLLRLLVVVLLGGLLDELALGVELAEEIRRRLGMDGRRGARIDVERHAEPFERTLDEVVVAVDDLLGRDPLLARLDRDRHAVLVAAADRQHVAPAAAQIARVDVGRDVDPRQMTDMHRPVGIGERRRHQIAFELFCHILEFLSSFSSFSKYYVTKLRNPHQKA